MALPSSGPISFGDINVEAGRTRTTANTNLAGGSTPQAGSLVKLYENSGVDQNAPHAVSEFYSISYATRINLYGRFGASPNNGNVDIYYSVDNGTNWIGSVAAVSSTNCDSLGYFDLSNPPSTIIFSTRYLGSPVYYNARETPASCPNNIGSFCEAASTFSLSITSNTHTVYFTIYVDGVGEYLGC